MIPIDFTSLQELLKVILFPFLSIRFYVELREERRRREKISYTLLSSSQHSASFPRISFLLFTCFAQRHVRKQTKLFSHCAFIPSDSIVGETVSRPLSLYLSIPVKSKSIMPGKRSSEAKRKSKSASRAAKHREMLGIPEWGDEIELAPQDLPLQAEEAECSEPDNMEIHEILSAIDELLASDSLPSSKVETLPHAASSDGQGDLSLVAYTSVPSAESEDCMMETEPLVQADLEEEEDVLQISATGEDIYYEVLE